MLDRTKTQATWNWIKSNALVIAMPIISGALALMVSYGSFIERNNNLVEEVQSLEEIIGNFSQEIGNLEDEVSDIEYELSNRIRENELEQVRELRDLDRLLVRIEARVDSVARRMELFDGIGAPALAPLLSIEPDTVETENVQPEMRNE